MLCRVVAVLVSCVVAEAVWAAPPSIIPPDLKDYACASSVSQTDLREHFETHGIEGGTARLGKFSNLEQMLQAEGLAPQRARHIATFVRQSVIDVSGGKAGQSPLLDILTLFEQKVKAGEINLVLLSDDVAIAEPFDNSFRDVEVLGANPWLIVLPSSVWRDEIQFAEEIVMGLAPAAAVQFLFKWRDACQEIVRSDREPKATYYSLLFDEKADNFKRPTIPTIGILYHHLVQHQLFKRNQPAKLAEFRAAAANGMSFALWDLADRHDSDPAISSLIRASFSHPEAFWDATPDLLGELNQPILRVAGRRN